MLSAGLIRGDCVYHTQQIAGCWDGIAPPDSEGSEKRTERQPINTPGFEKLTTAYGPALILIGLYIYQNISVIDS